MSINIIEVTDPRGAIAAPEWLARAEAVHRQLRPQLPPDYAAKMTRVFAGGGRMTVATDGSAGSVTGVAVWRVHENTHAAIHMYVDDLVTDQERRSQGVGRALLQWLEERARALKCTALTLDSGTQRRDAHRFYFREGLTIVSFNFRKTLD